MRTSTGNQPPPSSGQSAALRSAFEEPQLLQYRGRGHLVVDVLSSVEPPDNALFVDDERGRSRQQVAQKVEDAIVGDRGDLRVVENRERQSDVIDDPLGVGQVVGADSQDLRVQRP